MEQALNIIENEPEHTVEIVVHITETMGEKRRGDLVTALENNGGIVAAEFCPLRYLSLEPNYLDAHRARIAYLSLVDLESAADARLELDRALERAADYRPVSAYEEIILR